jgi:hypothetical protein
VFLAESILSLIGGFKHELYFPFHIWDVILPIDEVIFFKMVIVPPTRPLLTIINHGNPYGNPYGSPTEYPQTLELVR